MILKYTIALVSFILFFQLICWKNGEFCSSNYSSCYTQKNAGNRLVIDIQPFDDVSPNLVKYIHQEISTICPNIELKKGIPVPRTAFFAARNRYRADSLIDFLERITPNGHVVIGITSKDISATNGDISDWGVMGLSYCPGKSCVVSSFRLSKTNLQEQLFKTSIHELGHTMGLEHCPVKTCLMRDAKGKNTTNEEKEFCSKCKNFLLQKGWVLK